MPDCCTGSSPASHFGPEEPDRYFRIVAEDHSTMVCSLSLTAKIVRNSVSKSLESVQKR